MKKILVILLMMIHCVGFAQEKLSEEKRKEFDSQKIAFFTQELDLSPVEATKFWPLYNEMRKKIREIESSMRKKALEIKESKDVKEDVYKQAVMEMLSREQKMQDIKKEYFVKMLDVIPASKLWKLDEAERKFHRQLFARLKKESESKQK